MFHQVPKLRHHLLFLVCNFDTFTNVLFQTRKRHLNINLYKGTQCKAVSIPKIFNLWKIFNFAYLKRNVLSLRKLLRLYFSAFLGRNRIRLKRKWAIKWVLFEQRFYHDIKIILKLWSGQVRWLIGEVKINFTSQIVRGVENTGMPTLGYFALHRKSANSEKLQAWSASKGCASWPGSILFTIPITSLFAWLVTCTDESMSYALKEMGLEYLCQAGYLGQAGYLCQALFLFQTNPSFICMKYKSLENSMGKWEISLNPFPNDKFWTLPNWKSLRTTISNGMKMAESSANR